MIKISNQDRIYLAHNIKYLRNQKGWSQEQLAFESNTTSKCISALELAKRNVKIDTISKIAKSFEVPLSILLKSKI